MTAADRLPASGHAELPPDGPVRQRIDGVAGRFTPAERRVADVVVRRPQAVAFGTVARVAAAADASGATVVRFAVRAGFEGFAQLQAAVQEELAGHLRPATERVRQRLPRDLLGRATAGLIDNVHDTLAAVERPVFEHAVSLLSDADRRISVLSGDATHGVALMLASALDNLRPGVQMLTGSEARVARGLAHLEPGDVVVAVDLRRYERWVLATAERAVEAGAEVVAVTDSPLSPLARGAAATFVVAASGVGPFDSHVGALALSEVLAAAVAGRLRKRAARRLDRIEDAWRTTGALVSP